MRSLVVCLVVCVGCGQSEIQPYDDLVEPARRFAWTSCDGELKVTGSAADRAAVMDAADALVQRVGYEKIVLRLMAATRNGEYELASALAQLILTHFSNSSDSWGVLMRAVQAQREEIRKLTPRVDEPLKTLLRRVDEDVRPRLVDRRK